MRCWQMKEPGSAVSRGADGGVASQRGAVLRAFGLWRLKSFVFRNEVSMEETPKTWQIVG